MGIGESLYAYLITVSGVTDLVNRRIHSVVLPQNSPMPAITYQQLVATPTHTMGSDDGPGRDTYDINCWADNYPDAQDLADAVSTALKDLTGTMGSHTVQRILEEDRTDIHDSITETYHIVLEYTINYNPA